MKITKEWLEQEIAHCDKNIEFLRGKSDYTEEWQELLNIEEGIKEGFERVLFHKKMYNRSCVLFDKAVPMWKRHIIRALRHFCDWLEGVEGVKLFKRDKLEKKIDRNRNK